MKKQNIKEVAKLNNIAEIEALMTQHNTVSLRRLAIETETTYSLLLKAARTPVPGTILRLSTTVRSLSSSISAVSNWQTSIGRH